MQTELYLQSLILFCTLCEASVLTFIKLSSVHFDNDTSTSSSVLCCTWLNVVKVLFFTMDRILWSALLFQPNDGLRNLHMHPTAPHVDSFSEQVTSWCHRVMKEKVARDHANCLSGICYLWAHPNGWVSLKMTVIHVRLMPHFDQTQWMKLETIYLTHICIQRSSVCEPYHYVFNVSRTISSYNPKKHAFSLTSESKLPVLHVSHSLVICLGMILYDLRETGNLSKLS